MSIGEQIKALEQEKLDAYADYLRRLSAIEVMIIRVQDSCDHKKTSNTCMGQRQCPDCRKIWD